jgi:hypothetical protein
MYKKKIGGPEKKKKKARNSFELFRSKLSCPARALGGLIGTIISGDCWIGRESGTMQPLSQVCREKKERIFWVLL